LAEARERHAEARKQVASGIDPSAEKRAARQAAVLGAENTVKAIGEQWLAETAPHRAPAWSVRMRSHFDRFIVPAVGARPIAEVTAADVLAITKRIAATTPHTGQFVQQMFTRIFAYAVRHLKAPANPARELTGTIVVPATRHFDALDPKDIPAFLATLSGYGGRPATALAIRALLLTAVRKGELLGARWHEFDLESGTWLIPAARMKGRREHMVPLSSQALGVFTELKTLSFGADYVFPNMFDPHKAMSAGTLNAAFSYMKISADPHGLRSCFSTWANEHGYRSDVIEACLAHAEPNSVRGSYNRAMYWPERRKLMQDWADHVAGIAKVPQSTVVPMEGFRQRA
jgi:integrase